jgi:ATP-dependent DNA helicase RecG
MPEHQNMEWKESWNDEYFKWICGYANAHGGTLVIGQDDKGVIIGISNAKKLLKYLPDKIRDTMGIIVDVNLQHESAKEYIEIIVEKYPSLISYHGVYYYRSGSTMRKIEGAELEKTLIKRQGRTWDGVPLPRADLADLQEGAVAYFKEKAVKRGRLTEEDVALDNRTLLENLRLYEDNYLVRAAVMAFHKDPEKWIGGSYIKIGFFATDSDIRYHDEVHGPLLEQVDKAMDLIYTKYMKALIDYEGIHRIEQFMFHPDAFREILLNAIVHKDYSGCNPIQISVYDDKIYVWNDGTMPENLSTTEQLFKKHSSKPYNPKLAEIFFKSGMIEAWGRGFDKIKEACEKYDNAPLPEYDISNVGIMVLCKPCERYLRLLNQGVSLENDERGVMEGEQATSAKIQEEGDYDRILNEKLTSKEKKAMEEIIEYLQNNDTISNAKGRELTGKSSATVKRY